jgi:acyl-[acyl-carrier-protein] desaturase
VADKLLQQVSADENLHMIFYRDTSAAGLDIAPNQAMASLHRVLRNFKMPGYTVPHSAARPSSSPSAASTTRASTSTTW